MLTPRRCRRRRRSLASGCCRSGELAGAGNTATDEGTLRAAGSQEGGSSNAPSGVGGKETKEPSRRRGSWKLLAACEGCKVAWGQEGVAEPSLKCQGTRPLAAKLPNCRVAARSCRCFRRAAGSDKETDDEVRRRGRFEPSA